MNKIVLIGCGAVGSAFAYKLTQESFVNELVLIDANEEKAQGEAMDLMHGMAFSNHHMKIYAGNYDDCKDASIIIITAGTNQKVGETRLDLVERNTHIMKDIVKKIKNTTFAGIMVIASNPVDILTYVAYKESGLPYSRVIGTGTMLDTARFRVLLGDYFHVDARNVHASIIGEHGDSELPVFSHASIGLESLEKILSKRNNKDDLEKLVEIFDNTKHSAYEIIQKKGMTNFGIGTCLVRICKAIINNEQAILPLSCLLQGEYGEKDVYASVPVIIGNEGIRKVIELSLNEKEMRLFKDSCEVLRKTRI